MSFYDHTATCHRATESKGADFREVTRTWAAVAAATDFELALQVNREAREDAGPGERVRGEYNGYCEDAEIDVQEGDVLDVTAGPDSPATLYVEQVYRPANDHAEFVLSSWDGSLS